MGQYHRTLVIWVEHKSLPKLLRFLIWIVCLNWTNSPSDIKWSTYIWTQEHFLRTFAETALFCEQFIDQGVYQPGDRQTHSIGFSKLILPLIISFLFIVEDDLARDLIFGDPYITKHSKVHCFCIFTQRWLWFLSLFVSFCLCLWLFVFAFVFLSLSVSFCLYLFVFVCVLKGGSDEANHWLPRSVYWLHLQLLPRKLRWTTHGRPSLLYSTLSWGGAMFIKWTLPEYGGWVKMNSLSLDSHIHIMDNRFV